MHWAHPVRHRLCAGSSEPGRDVMHLPPQRLPLSSPCATCSDNTERVADRADHDHRTKTVGTVSHRIQRAQRPGKPISSPSCVIFPLAALTEVALALLSIVLLLFFVQQPEGLQPCLPAVAQVRINWR